MKGIINLNKPKGWTSRDAVNKVRNVLHVSETGHMGTLDPQGEGVLLIGIGKGTRLFDALLKKDKVYRADFTFGYETDTLDGDGTVIKTTAVIPTYDQVETALSKLCGDVMQLPPAFSAKNVGGVRAYDLARKGKEVELKPSPVSIYSLKVVERKDENTFTVEVHCSAGTYVRSICRDLATLVGSLATMTSITRLRTGNFTIAESVTVDEFLLLKEKAIIPLEKALEYLPRYDVDEREYKRLSNGIKIDVEDCAFTDLFTVYCRNELFGLGEVIDKKLRIKTYLKD